ncbi:MAG TPA: ATP-binding protein [Nitrososphaera sp.]|nr:ATP-binding protein [Nitrososphaera sp.]
MSEEDYLPVGVSEEEFSEHETERIASLQQRRQQKQDQKQELPVFDSIVGYDDVKRLFQMSLSSDKPVHILLVGPPASAKTLFMLECMKLERSYFTLGSHSTKSGMIDYLFEKRPRYLIVDEIEHMPMKDQTALLSLMETGIVAETKFQKTRNTQMKTWVFATSNGTERMLTPLLSRFVVLHFKQYSVGSFTEICTHLLAREGVTSDIATAIADAVWNTLKSKDIRDCVKLGRLAKSKDDVAWIAQTMRNYKKQ